MNELELLLIYTLGIIFKNRVKEISLTYKKVKSKIFIFKLYTLYLPLKLMRIKIFVSTRPSPSQKKKKKKKKKKFKVKKNYLEKKNPKNLFDRKGNFKRHLRIPHSSPSSPIIHFSRAHVPWTLNFFPANSSIVSARLNSISIHAKSAPNSLFDPVARLLYVYMCVRVCTTLIPHAPPYTRNSLHIPRIYIESSDIFHRSYSAQHCGTLVTRTRPTFI